MTAAGGLYTSAADLGRSKYGSDLSVAAHLRRAARASWQLRVVCCPFRHQHAGTKRTHQKTTRATPSDKDISGPKARLEHDPAADRAGVQLEAKEAGHGREQRPTTSKSTATVLLPLIVRRLPRDCSAGASEPVRSGRGWLRAPTSRVRTRGGAADPPELAPKPPTSARFHLLA
jgi:hypothetical protein